MSQSKIENLNFKSNILGKEMKVSVYLPEGYDNLTPLPVLYFLHGRSGNENMGILEKHTIFGGEKLSSNSRIKCLKCEKCNKIIIDLDAL